MPYESPNIVIVPTAANLNKKRNRILSAQNTKTSSLPNISNVLVPSVMAFEVNTNVSNEAPKPSDASQNVNTVANEETKSAETSKVTQSEVLAYKNNACTKVNKSVKKTTSWATNYLQSIGQCVKPINLNLPSSIDEIMQKKDSDSLSEENCNKIKINLLSHLKVKKLDSLKMGPPPLQNHPSASTSLTHYVNTNSLQTQPSYINTNCFPNNHVNTNFMPSASFNPQTNTNTWQPINFVQNAYFFRPHIEQNAWPTQTPYPNTAMPSANYLTEYMERERQNYSYLYPDLTQGINYAPYNMDTTMQTPASTITTSPSYGYIATNNMNINTQHGSDNNKIKILSDINLNVLKSDDKAKNKNKETITNIPNLQKISSESTQQNNNTKSDDKVKNKSKEPVTNIPKLQKVSSESRQQNNNTKDLIKSTLVICKDSVKLKKEVKSFKSQKPKLSTLISKKKLTHKKIMNKKFFTERKPKESSTVKQVNINDKKKTSINDKKENNLKDEIRTKRKRDDSTRNHDIPSKKRSRHDVQSSIKSVVRLPKKQQIHPRIKAPESDCSDEYYDFDLRSKLSRKNYKQCLKRNQTCLSHEKNEVDTLRENLVITINQNDNHDANTEQLKPQTSKPKTKKYKKIKLIINVICEKSEDSSEESMSDDDNSKESVCENVIKRNVDLSFLDDLNIDEIVNSLEHSPKQDSKQQNVRETVQSNSAENTKKSQHKKIVQPIRISDIKIEAQSDTLHNDIARKTKGNICESIFGDVIEDPESTNESSVNIKEENQDDEMAENFNADDETLSLENDTYNSHVYLNDIATSDSSICSKRNSDGFENIKPKEMGNVVKNIKQENQNDEIENLNTDVQETETSQGNSTRLENNKNRPESSNKQSTIVAKPQEKDTALNVKNIKKENQDDDKVIYNLNTDCQENEVLLTKKIKREIPDENSIIKAQKTDLQKTKTTEPQKENKKTFLVKAIKQENQDDNQNSACPENYIANIVTQPVESEKASLIENIKQENLNTGDYNKKTEIASQPIKPYRESIYHSQKKVTNIASDNAPIPAEAVNNAKNDILDNSDVIMIDLENDTEVICLSDTEDVVLENNVPQVTTESKLLKFKNIPDDTNNKYNKETQNKNVDKITISNSEAVKNSNVVNDAINTSKTINVKKRDDTNSNHGKNKNDDKMKTSSSKQVKACNVVNDAINTSKTIDPKKPNGTNSNHDKNKNDDKMKTSASKQLQVSNVVKDAINTSKTIDSRKPDGTNSNHDKNKNDDKMKTSTSKQVKVSNVVNDAIKTSKTIDVIKPDNTNSNHDKNKNDDKMKTSSSKQVKASNVVNDAIKTSKTTDPKKPNGTNSNHDKNKNDDKMKTSSSKQVKASNVVNDAIKTSITIDPKKPNGTNSNHDKNKNDEKMKTSTSKQLKVSNVVNDAINTSKTIDPTKPDGTNSNHDKNKNDEKIKTSTSKQLKVSNVVNDAINTSRTINPKKPDGTNSNHDKNKNDEKMKTSTSKPVKVFNVVNDAINTSKTIDPRNADDTNSNHDKNKNDDKMKTSSKQVIASNVVNDTINTSKTIHLKKPDGTNSNYDKEAQNKNDKIASNGEEVKVSNVVSDVMNTSKTTDPKTKGNTTENKLNKTSPKNMAEKRIVQVMSPSLKDDKVLSVKIEERILNYLKLKLNVISLIRNGKFSKVFKCKDTSGQNYSVKVITNINERQRLGVQKEDMWKQLQNDIPKEKLNTVYLINGLSLDGRWCFLMEYYPKNLLEVLKVKTFSIDDVQMLTRQLISAILVLRNNNVVHSDIKPSHILLDATERKLKLCGFDSSYYINSARAIPNIGTLSYRAPEVIVGLSAGFSIDVWASALVAYQMATGTRLFCAMSNNDLLYKQMCLFGHLPFDMILTAPYAGNHFMGTAFIKRVRYPAQNIIITQFFDTNKLHNSLFNAYKRLWGKSAMKKEFEKLSAMYELLDKMLVMDPRRRLPIEFVYADPFLYDTTDFTEFVN